jgi:phytoene synthase
VRVFGLRKDDGIALAHHLGRALQLTNILRDLDEDAAVGRLYLPREALQDAGVMTTDPASALAHRGLTEACVPVAKRALVHFAEADKIMAYCPRRRVRAPRIMGKVYRSILTALVARGFAPPRHPVRVGRARLLWILLCNAFI